MLSPLKFSCNLLQQLVLALFLICLNTNSQTKNNSNYKKNSIVFIDSIKTIEISGYILDSLLQDGIFNLTVLLQHNNDSIKIAKTNLVGYFKLTIDTPDSLNNYTIYLKDINQNYDPSKISLINLLKNNTIYLSKNKNYYRKAEIILTTGCTFRNKPKKKWFQFWKK